MKYYEKPFLKEEIVEIDDIVATSLGVKNSVAGWDGYDDEGGDLETILS